MSPKYILNYFNLRGRGELIRLAFHVAGVQFEDKRIQGSDWPALKPKTPFGTLPYLTIDGKDFGESMAIVRYIARKYNLSGKTDLEQLEADIIMCLIDDIRNTLSRARNDKILTEDQKKELQDRAMTEMLPKLLSRVEQKLAESKNGYIVGDAVTVADLAFMDMCDTLIKNVPNMLDQFPKLTEHRKKIQSHPRLTKYLASRPDTPI